MKLFLVAVLSLLLFACHNKKNTPSISAAKIIHIPDTTNNSYATLFDYDAYVRKKVISRQLKLTDLETDTSGLAIRIWAMASNVNPQYIYVIKADRSMSTLSYYQDFDSRDSIKIDSFVYRNRLPKMITPDEWRRLNIDQLWTLPSQSEMENGSNFSCMDGGVVLIELSNKERYKYAFYRCPNLLALKDVIFKKVETLMNKLDSLSFY